ncbi:hypothetical protein J3B02_003047, partial [Coemansia erecta]
MDNSSDSNDMQEQGQRRKTSTFGLEDSSDEESYTNFYRKTERQNRRQQSREQRMLGIWAEDGSDNESAGLGAASALNPIGFVAATELTSETTDIASETQDKNYQTAERKSSLNTDIVSVTTKFKSDTGEVHLLESRAGFKSTSRSGSGSTSGSSSETDSDSDSSSSSDSASGSARGSGRAFSQNKPAANSPHPLPSKEFGKFANSTIWKMMAKMGYTPGQGLGKHGEGRVEPVKVHLRNAREGIASSGSERPPEDLPLGKKKMGSDGIKPKMQQKNPSLAPRSYSARLLKTEYKLVDELETQTQARMKEVFVDMTTNTEAASLAELVSKRIPASEKEKLENDVRLGLDLAFVRIQDYKGELVQESNRHSTLSTEIALLQKSIEKRRLRIESFKAARTAALAAETVAKGIEIDSPATARADLDSLFAAFADMRSLCKQLESRCGFSVWDELQLERVVTSTMHPHLARLFRMWDPLNFPQLLQDVLEPLRQYVKVNGSLSEAQDMTPLESLLAEILVPRLKQFLFTEWDPMADSLIALLDFLPQVTVAAISQDIGAVLQRHVDALDPREIMRKYDIAERSANEFGSSVPLSSPLKALRVDHAVIPWLPFIADHRELISSIRRKLCTALDHWEPSKANNKDIIALTTP